MLPELELLVGDKQESFPSWRKISTPTLTQVAFARRILTVDAY